MSAIQETIDYVKEDGEFSDCKEQIELAESAQAEFDALNKYLNELGILMPCGHLARYAVNGEGGTQYCCMCLAEETQKELGVLQRFCKHMIEDDNE